MSDQLDPKDGDLPYYPVLIIGAGASGIATGAQLKQKLGFRQSKIFDRQSGIGGKLSDGSSLKDDIHNLKGTWWINRYPGVMSLCPLKSSVKPNSWPSSNTMCKWLIAGFATPR
jgi:hypothetical protein